MTNSRQVIFLKKILSCINSSTKYKSKKAFGMNIKIKIHKQKYLMQFQIFLKVKN